jgi:ABC-type Mn2+/Zn2+ transport system permease subunit
MDWLVAPLEYEFLRRALAEAVLMGAACGLLGVLVMLRGLSYAGESLSHALLPGAAIAVALGAPAAGGAVLAAVAAAILVAVLLRRPDIGQDVSIGIVLPASFAVGVVVLSQWGTPRDLDSLLFGSILAAGPADVQLGAAALLLALAVIAVAGRRMVLVSFDRSFARVLGARPGLLDAVLLAGLALALAVALRGVGTLLVLALLLAPPATARLLVPRVATMLWLSPLLGVASGIAGLYLSYHADLAASPSIALVAIGLFVLALAAAPARRLVARPRPAASPA